jgi:hypothetical protein
MPRYPVVSDGISLLIKANISLPSTSGSLQRLKICTYFWGGFAHLQKKAPISFVMSVRLSASIGAAAVERISVKFGIGDF